MQEIEVPVITSSEETLPQYCSTFAAGADVKAHVTESITIEPGASVLIPTGVFMEIPEGFEVQIRPRSGLALKSQITVLNTPGTIDSDYRGEVKVILINHGKNPFIVTPNMRIAQCILAPVVRAKFVRKESLAETSRGAGGFGHTGV